MLKPNMNSPEWADMIHKFDEKFERKTEHECWPWIANANQFGKGRIHMRGIGGLVASRVSFAIANGRWPEKYVCHSCDNPNCVNPAHLWEGEQSQNMLDCSAKGRWGLPRERAKRSPKLVCKRGHSRTGFNLLPKGGCRACFYIKRNEWRAKRRESNCSRIPHPESAAPA